MSGETAHGKHSQRQSWTSKTEVDLTKCLSVTFKADTSGSSETCWSQHQVPIGLTELMGSSLIERRNSAKKSGTMTLMAGRENVERFLLPINSHIAAIGRGQRLVREQPAKLSFV